MPSINWIDPEEVKLLSAYNIYLIGRSQLAPVDDVEPGLPTVLDGLPNVWQIPVKEKICNSRSNGAFYRDEIFPHFRLYVCHELDKMETSAKGCCMKNVFWHAKIGTGCSRLKELAPICYKWLIETLTERYGK